MPGATDTVFSLYTVTLTAGESSGPVVGSLYSRDGVLVGNPTSRPDSRYKRQNVLTNILKLKTLTPRRVVKEILIKKNQTSTAACSKNKLYNTIVATK
jgi:hypothetical protein